MPDRIAILLAVETPQDPAVPPAAHAASDALALADVFERLGFARDRQIHLLEAQATRTAIESRLRKFAKSVPPSGVAVAPEAVVAFVAGQVLSDGGESYLVAHDTQLDDLPETAFPLRALLDALAACRSSRVILLLDARGGLPPEALPRGVMPSLHEAQFGDFTTGHPTRACLVSRATGEESHGAGAPRGGIWARLVTEALEGKAPLALEDGRLLTAGSLQAHLERELPRALRASFREGRPQTPGLWADDDGLLLADVAGLVAGQAGADPRLQQLLRGVLRAEERMKTKSLSGFRKFHRLPEKANAYGQKFVSDLAADDIKADVDARYAAVREHLGYKRRDVEGSSDRGSGFVRTPDFEYSVSIEMAADDPATVVWRREVGGIRNPEVVLGKGFQTVFGGLFDTLAFEFAKAFDLEAWVDRVEEQTPAGVKLRCASDCSSCDIVVVGFAGVIRLLRDRVEVQGRQGGNSRGLVEAFLSFQDTFGTGPGLLALPLNPPGDGPGR